MIFRLALLWLLALCVAAPTAGAVGFAPAPGSPYAAGFRPSGAAAGDVNGDGRDDVVAATGSNPGRIAVLVSAPNGALTAVNGSPFASGAGTTLRSVALADMNGDGKLDVVAGTDSTPGQIVVMLGAGNGTFAPAPGSPNSVNAGMLYPISFDVADVTGEGVPDVVTANYAPALMGSVSVLKGTGTGAIAPIVGSPFASTEITLYDVDAADINGDGRRDLVWIHYVPGTAYYRLALAGGGFGAQSAPISANAGGAPDKILAQDVDGDGKVDLAFPNSLMPNSDITVLKGNGMGGFAPMPGSSYDTTADGGYALEAVDVDADGKLELVSSHDNASPAMNPVTELSVLARTAGGGFAAVTGSPFAWGTVRATTLAVGDFNSDFQPDFATADAQNVGEVGVLLNTLAGKLTPSRSSVAFGTLGFGQATTTPFQLTNTGTGFSRLARISLRGANPGDFNVNNGCAPQLLLRGATCSLGVIFSPFGPGPRSAILDLHQIPGPVVSIPLTGNGPVVATSDRIKPVISGLKLSPEALQGAQEGEEGGNNDRPSG